jgi:hypothetical protein
MVAYQAVTGHYIDDDWRLNSQLLTLTELEGRHTGENMALDLLNTIATHFGIEKVVISNNRSAQLSTNAVLPSARPCNCRQCR